MEIAIAATHMRNTIVRATKDLLIKLNNGNFINLLLSRKGPFWWAQTSLLFAETSNEQVLPQTVNKLVWLPFVSGEENRIKAV
jgi:hypothetical protein